MPEIIDQVFAKKPKTLVLYDWKQAFWACTLYTVENPDSKASYLHVHWRLHLQVANSLDKEHSKEYKKLRSELKKKTDNSLRLMKKHKKTKGCVQSPPSSHYVRPT